MDDARQQKYDALVSRGLDQAYTTIELSLIFGVSDTWIRRNLINTRMVVFYKNEPITDVTGRKNVRPTYHLNP